MTDSKKPIGEFKVDFNDGFDDELNMSLADKLAALAESRKAPKSPIEAALSGVDIETTPPTDSDGNPIASDELVARARPGEPAWYVIHCYSGYENKVHHNIDHRVETMGMSDYIFDVIVPSEEEVEVKEGKRKTIERRVFPGYMLVNMILTDDSWFVVRNTPGVTGFVGMGNEPTPLPEAEVDKILQRMEAEAPRIKVSFKVDQKVRIIDGPFNDFIGNVSEIDMERAKVRVMVSFFGRETPVELDFLQVEKT